jgi:glycosyltransferase involved in cell wall biosynthesis
VHLAFLCSEYPPSRGGGIGTFTQALGRALARAGHRVDVVGLYDVDEDLCEEDQGVRVWRLRRAEMPLTRFLRNGWKATRKLRALRSEGLELVEGPENAFAALPRLPGLKKVIRMHGGHHFFAVTLGRKPKLWRAWQEKRSFEQADAICAVSRYVAEVTRELLGLGDMEIPILPNPVDVSVFRPIPDIPEEPGLIVFAGTVCRKKGLEPLIRSMETVLREVPEARLVVAGRDQAEPGVGSFREYLLRLMPPEVRRAVSFLGPVAHHELPELYARAQVCVFPSFMESQGIVFVEAMAMGKALVAPGIPPVLEMLEDEVQALVCDPHDPETIAAGLIRCLRDAELRRRLGAQGRQRAVERFSTEVLLAKNLAFYRQVLEQKAGRHAAA